MVRSNPDSRVGDLLTDWRRMNVSFTRAKSKLVIIGSRSTLTAVDILRRFLDLMEEKGWILTLPHGALGLHDVSSLVAPSPKRSLGTPQVETTAQTPRKKAKLDAGIFKGRPILKDLFNGA
jgi:DNA replication ATP-dependent helicase Dna2